MERLLNQMKAQISTLKREIEIHKEVEKELAKNEAEFLMDQCVQSYCILSRFSAPSGPLTFNQEPKKFDLDGMMRGYPAMRPS